MSLPHFSRDLNRDLTEVLKR